MCDDEDDLMPFASGHVLQANLHVRCSTCTCLLPSKNQKEKRDYFGETQHKGYAAKPLSQIWWVSSAHVETSSSLLFLGFPSV